MSRGQLCLKKTNTKQNYSGDITLACDTERLCFHLNLLTPTVGHWYVHVNMAGAGAIAAVTLERPGKEDFFRTKNKSTTLEEWCPCVDETRWRLSTGYVRTAAQQRGMDDSVADRIKYSLHSRPNAH